jgi:hypothetical protein
MNMWVWVLIMVISYLCVCVCVLMYCTHARVQGKGLGTCIGTPLDMGHTLGVVIQNHDRSHNNVCIDAQTFRKVRPSSFSRGGRGGSKGSAVLSHKLPPKF